MKFSACVVIILCLAAAAPAQSNTLQIVSGELHAWQTIEFTLDTPAPANPYDPDLVRLDAEIVRPTGETVNLPGFWYQPYTRSLADGTENLAPQPPAGWRVRFLPREPGNHRIKVILRQGDSTQGVYEKAFEVGAPAGKLQGLVRVEPTARRYFMLDNGTPFFLMGMNTCWHYNAGTADYEKWFPNCEKAGMNYCRLWMWKISFGLEVLPGERLNYNQERAWRLDRTLDLAAEHGLRVMLCLDFHGIFQSEPDYWKANDDWKLHPYNTANGGPCATQNDFFTNPEARKLYQKRLRYIIARYGSYPAIMSWQFFNEINNVYKNLNPPDVVNWHDAMGKWLKANDPYNHLITTSFSGSTEAPQMWGLDCLDYTMSHPYLEGLETKDSPAKTIARRANRFYTQFNKPFYVGEYGVTYKGFGEDLDPYFRGMKQGVWGGAMCGSAGTGMSWWWEMINDKNLYPIWTSLSGFLKDTGIGHPAWHPVDVPDEGPLTTYAMTDGIRTLLWMLDKRYEYPQNATQPAQPIASATARIPIPNGAYEVTWWDTVLGSAIKTETVGATANTLVLNVPQFAVDVAAKIVPKM